jgi:lipoate-protein ligase B
MSPAEVIPVTASSVSSRGENSPVLDMQIKASGVEVHAVKRGGEVTYHGPGQCVLYPVMDVRRMGARAFVEKLENSIIATLGAWGIHSRSASGSTAGVGVSHAIVFSRV